MSGHRPFSDLKKEITPERRRRIDAMKAEMLAEMELSDSRPQPTDRADRQR